MMNSIMISIKPKWCELIASGKKTIEVRKTRPKCDTPFKCYIYCTKPKERLLRVYSKKDYEGYLGYEKMKDDEKVFVKTFEDIDDVHRLHLCGKVIGEFVCDNIVDIFVAISNPKKIKKPYEIPCTGLTDIEIMNYLGNGIKGYGWHISDLKIYDEPKELSEFYKIGALSYDDWLYRIYNGHRGARSSYESYSNIFRLSRPPQSWCYVEEAK